MKIISVYSEAGIAKVYIEEWKNGERARKKSYSRLSIASINRLGDIVNKRHREGRMGLRPFLGGCIGYVAEESTDEMPQMWKQSS